MVGHLNITRTTLIWPRSVASRYATHSQPPDEARVRGTSQVRCGTLGEAPEGSGIKQHWFRCCRRGLRYAPSLRQPRGWRTVPHGSPASYSRSDMQRPTAGPRPPRHRVISIRTCRPTARLHTFQSSGQQASSRTGEAMFPLALTTVSGTGRATMERMSQ